MLFSTSLRSSFYLFVIYVVCLSAITFNPIEKKKRIVICSHVLFAIQQALAFRITGGMVGFRLGEKMSAKRIRNPAKKKKSCSYTLLFVVCYFIR